jgi:hypothetical protein
VTRFGITLPAGASTPDVVRDITAVNTAIESLAARYEQGTLSAGLWKIVMSCDVTQSSLAGTPLNARLDVQIVSGATTFRAAGSGDELSVQTNGTLSFASSSKQTSVTVTGSGANLSVWAEGATGTSIKNIAVSVEPVSL